MKLIQEQIDLVKENMQFYKDLLDQMKNDPAFDEESLQDIIFERFHYSEGFYRMARLFGNTGHRLGYVFDNKGNYDFKDHDTTVAIFTEIVANMQKELDARLSSQENVHNKNYENNS